jgi:hypothetical protein
VPIANSYPTNNGDWVSIQLTAARRALIPSHALLRASPLARCAQFLDALRVDSCVALLPTGILAPNERCLRSRARQRGALEQVAGVAHDGALHLAFVGPAAGIAEGKVAEQEARNATLFDDVAGATHDDCGDAIGFEVACNQTHGLVADGSERNQQRGVDPILSAAAQNLGGVKLDGAALAVVGGHTVEVRGNGADPALAGQGLPHGLPRGKSLNRKRATPHCSTMSRAEPTTTVAMPFSSKCLETRLTVWWQTGHNGTSSATSTASSRQRRRISGASCSAVRRWL